MDIPILKYLDVLIGFTLIMILASTVVASITQLCSVLARSRGRYLANSLCLLLSQTDPVNLPQPIASKLVEEILRHPLIGKPNLLRSLRAFLSRLIGKRTDPTIRDRLRGTVIKREELVCMLLYFAAGNNCSVAEPLRKSLGVGAAEASRLREEIEKQILALESAEPNQAACVRETQSMKMVLEKSNAYTLVGRLTAWFDHAMNRVTLSYASEAKVATAVVALGLAVWLQLDSLAILQRLATDDKMRAALVQQADRQQQWIGEVQKRQASAATASTSPAYDLELLQNKKAELEASIADLSQPGFGILTPFYQSATLPGTSVSAGRCDLAFGTKVYPLTHTKEGLAELASLINGLGAGVVARVRGSGKSAYLNIRGMRPNINTLELRMEAAGVNIMGRPTVFHSQSSEARSEPIEIFEAGKYRLNLGKRTFEVAVQEKQTPMEVANAINALNANIRARTTDGANCRDCVLVLTALVPDFTHLKLLTDSGKADLIKHITVNGGRVQATTHRIPSPVSRDFQLTLGGQKYDAIKLGDKESFAELAAKLNASKAGADLRAEITNTSGEDCRDCYILTLAGEVPDVADVGFRKHVGGSNILGPVEPYYSFANLADSWKGIFLSWVLLSLGTPFWYDILKNLLRLRPILAKQEEQERAHRQARQ